MVSMSGPLRIFQLTMIHKGGIDSFCSLKSALIILLLRFGRPFNCLSSSMTVVYPNNARQYVCSVRRWMERRQRRPEWQDIQLGRWKIGRKKPAMNTDWGGQSRQWPVLISTFPQRSSAHHGDSAFTPWLLCKLKFPSLEKPVWSLKGRPKIIVAISRRSRKTYFVVQVRILSHLCISILTPYFPLWHLDVSLWY